MKCSTGEGEREEVESELESEPDSEPVGDSGSGTMEAMVLLTTLRRSSSCCCRCKRDGWIAKQSPARDTRTDVDADVDIAGGNGVGGNGGTNRAEEGGGVDSWD